jgi:hypothetical protein
MDPGFRAYALRTYAPLSDIGPKPFIVRGHVRRADGTPLFNFIIRAFDRDLRMLQLLGEVRTNVSGSYEIRYGPSQFTRSGKIRADLEVAVFTHGDLLLAESEVRFNAQPIETIDLNVHQQS